MTEYIVAKYIRLSLDDTKSGSMSIENQRIMLDKHIDGLETPNIAATEFIDNGYSGTNFERPAVQELLDLVRMGKVNCIVVKDFSRFGRNAIETGYFIERVFPLYGIRFISVSDHFDSDDFQGDTGGIEIAFQFLINEYYSRDLSKKIKSAKHEKMRRGESVRKNCLFGYKLNDKRQMVIDEAAAATVRLIFKLALENNSIEKIAKRLYEDKLPNPSAHKGRTHKNPYIWTSSYIRHMLSEEQYTGTYIAGRQAIINVGSRVTVPQPESKWYKIPNHHPAIIEQAVFAEVREIIRQKREPVSKQGVKKSKKGRYNENLLCGKVVCESCGHIMASSNTKNAKFQCRYTKAASDAECHNLSVSEQDLVVALHKVISEQAQAILSAESLRDLNWADLPWEQESEYDNSIDLIQTEKRELYEHLVNGGISTADYKEETSKLDAELDRLKGAYTNIYAEKHKSTDSESLNDIIKAAEAAIRGKVLTRQIVESLIEQVYVYPDTHIKVAWKVPGFEDWINQRHL